MTVTPAVLAGRAAALQRRLRAAAAAWEPAPAAPARLSALGVVAVVLSGLALGLGATAVVLARGWDPGAVAVGPWVVRPGVGTPGIDPYARAEFARSGAVPMAASEGLSFTATTDDTGYRLLRTCSYRIGGTVPAARLWTLSATGRDGRSVDGVSGLPALTSATVVRDIGGTFSIEAGPAARPGNWLPLSGEGPLTLTLRLYDTPLTADPTRLATAVLPPVERLSCARAGR